MDERSLQRCHQKEVAVLQLVLQHSTAASQVKTLCTLLKVSRTLQQAVLQAAGRSSLALPGLSIDVYGRYSTSRLAACCAWMPKHAGLIKKLTFGVGWAASLGSMAGDVGALSTAYQLVSFAFRMCAANVPAVPTASVGAVAPLQLQSLTAVWELADPSILDPVSSTLSASTGLTYLDLTYSLEQPGHQAALYTAIGRLPGLQQLALHNRAPATTMGAAFAHGVEHLQCLRGLKLGNAMQPAAVEALPASLQSLRLMLGDDADITLTARWYTMQLHHLSNLQELQLQCAYIQPSAYSILAAEDPVVAVAGLQQLHSLHLADAFAMSSMVTQLSTVKQLRVLEVGLQAAHWLGLQLVPQGPPPALVSCLAGIAAATQLTRLRLFGQTQLVPLAIPAPMGVNPPAVPTSLHGVELHRYLQDLTQLQHLQISNLGVQPDDVVNFTALSALTALRMYNCWSVGPTAPAAVACRLPNLRVLELVACEQGDRVLWLLGLATRLERLVLENSTPYNPPMLDSTAMQLMTGLTRLTSLIGPKVPDYVEGYEAFRAALPNLVELPAGPWEEANYAESEDPEAY